jgi:ferredoxin--NADP+ reductase
MLEDAAAGVLLQPPNPDADSVEAYVRRTRPEFVSWDGWRRIQAAEEEEGKASNRPRVKLTTREEILAALYR